MVEIVIQLAGNFFPSPDRRKKLRFVTDSVRIMTVKMSEQETGQKIVPVTVSRRTGLVQIEPNPIFFVKMGRKLRCILGFINPDQGAAQYRSHPGYGFMYVVF